mgnify:FL=1
MAQEFNKGDVAELILSAAIAARFKRRLSETRLAREQIISIGDLPRISSGEVKSVLRDIVNNSFRSQYNVQDRNLVEKIISKVTDNIQVEVNIPQLSSRYISAPPVGSRFSKFEDIINTATNFVNADIEIKRKVFRTQFNLKQDLIEIKGVGTKEQKKTKVDIRVDITTGGRMISRRSSQISLKYTAPQFAQSVGLQFDKFANIFEPLGIVDYVSDEAEFNKAIFDVYPDILGKRFESRNEIMESNEVKALKAQAAKIFNGKILRQLRRLINDDNFKETLAKFCEEKATNNESGVELVKFLTEGLFLKQTFGQKFIDSVKSTNFSVTVKESDNPTIVIHKTGGGVDSDKLIQFRYRADARKPKNQDEYLILMRTLVESGPLLYKLGVTDE